MFLSLSYLGVNVLNVSQLLPRRKLVHNSCHLCFVRLANTTLAALPIHPDIKGQAV
jgi:hypothetical protein